MAKLRAGLAFLCWMVSGAVDTFVDLGALAMMALDSVPHPLRGPKGAVLPRKNRLERQYGHGHLHFILSLWGELQGALGSFWQRRFYDFDVYTEKKKVEKLQYMHLNPVTRGLVPHPKPLAWSSYRFCRNREEGLCTPDLKVH